MKFRVLTERATFDEAGFARIYKESFPPSERTPTDVLLTSIARGTRICMLAEKDDVTVGIAIVLPLQGVEADYLEYFAIVSTLRGRGVGTQLLERLVRHLVTRHPTCQGLVLEVEPPDQATGEERAIRTRRVDFYLRNHVTLVGDAPRYRAPSLTSSKTLPFHLMWCGLPAGPPRLEGPLLRRCVSAILVEGYDLASTDPLVGEVVAGLIS